MRAVRLFPRPALGLLVAVLATVVVAGIALRAADALADPVIPAEDPYTHMTLVQEHLRDGRIDPQQRQGSLYPPGLHAFLAAWWSFAGGDLADLMRFGPSVLGGAGLLGIAVLLGQREGGVAALVGTLALALAPEEVIRTAMMAPTALDLAILPALLYSGVQLARGRLGWVAPLAVLTLFLVLAHPWVLALLALGGIGFLALSLAFPWSTARAPPLHRPGAAVACAVLASGLALAALTRWDQSDSGFSDLAGPLADRIGAAGLALAAAGILLVVVLALLGDRLPAPLRPRAPRLVGRIAGIVVLALLVAAIVATALAQGLPPHVKLQAGLGWPLLALAVLGLLVLPLAGSPAGHLGGALFLALLPLSLHNPLDSPFWPHRTVAYLGLGAVLLAGLAAGRLAEVATRLAHRRASATRRHGTVAFAAAAPLLLVASGASIALVAETPEPWPWYRLFDACEAEALRQVGTLQQAEPRTIVFADAWQSKLVIASFSPEPGRVWIDDDIYEAADPEAYLAKRGLLKRPVVAVLTRYLDADPEVRTDFLDAPPWSPMVRACTDGGKAGVVAYLRPAGPRVAPTPTPAAPPPVPAP